MKDLLLGLALLSCPGIVFAVFGNSGREAFNEGALRPTSYAETEEGQMTFAEDCAPCHGHKAEGTGRGPALVQPLYGPAQLTDQRFREAVRAGTPARHWDFGAMPAFPDLPESKLDQMLAFVRENQHAHGVR
jgi:mono/diheme cytochrome c family protein